MNTFEGSSLSPSSLEPSTRDRSRVKRIQSSTVASSAHGTSTSKRKRRTRRSEPSSDEPSLASLKKDADASSSSPLVTESSKISPNPHSPSNPRTTTGGVELVVQTRKGTAAERKRRIAIHETHLVLLTQHMVFLTRALLRFANEDRSQLLLLTDSSTKTHVSSIYYYEYFKCKT